MNSERNIKPKLLKVNVLLYLRVIFFLLFLGPIFAQVNKDQPGGYCIPSNGEINILLVFAQFPDDNYDLKNKFWRSGGAPADMESWVEEKWRSNPAKGYLTDYFNQMSFNKLKLSGKEVYAVAPHSRKWYLQNRKNRAYIHKDILMQLDSTMDFGEFDKWTTPGLYQHLNKPDGNIEMVIFVWRNIAAEFPQKQRDSIEMMLNFDHDYGSLGGGDLDVDDSLRTIKLGDLGSGVTIRDYANIYNSNRLQLFRIVVHEFSHYLLGHNSYHNGFGFWGMLASWGIKSLVTNSFERHRLGWITCNTISRQDTQTIRNASLTDYVTTGASYRLVIDSAKGQYFYLENHQLRSYWETEFKLGNIEPGLYVLRKDAVTTTTGNDVPNSAYFRMIPASGRFKWEVHHKIKNPWGADSLPVFKNISPDIVNGFHDLEFIQWTWNGIKQKPDVIHFTESNSGKIQNDLKYSGDGYDSFRKDYNEVFSPWSNPNSQDVQRLQTPYGFYIKNSTSGVYSLDIYVHTALAAPPSKPQGLNVSINGNSGKQHPQLKWLLNSEEDVKKSNRAYIIERSENDGPFKQIIEVNGQTDTYKDMAINPGDYAAVSYRIKARDTSNLLSVYSTIAELKNNPVTSGN